MAPNKGTQAAIQKAKSEFAARLQEHLLREHDLRIGLFEAEEIFTESFSEIAPILYNQGLNDAKDYFLEHFSTLADDLFQLEISTGSSAGKRKKQ